MGATKQPGDRLRSRKKPVSTHVDVVFDQDVVDRLEEMQEKADEAKFAAEAGAEEHKGSELAVSLQTTASALKAEVDAARDAAFDNGDIVRFKFQSLSRKAWDQLIDAHQPTEAEIAEAKKNGEPKPTTGESFSIAMIVASLVDPKMTEDEFRTEIWDNEDWNSTETTTLYGAAMTINNSRRITSLGNEYGRRRA